METRSQLSAFSYVPAAFDDKKSMIEKLIDGTAKPFAVELFRKRTAMEPMDDANAVIQWKT